MLDLKLDKFMFSIIFDKFTDTFLSKLYNYINSSSLFKQIFPDFNHIPYRKNLI